MHYRVGILLVLAAALAAPAWAQSPQWPDPPSTQPKAKQKAKQPPLDDVEELTPAQIKRAQEREPPPGSKDAPQSVKRPPKGGGAPARQIACSGPFAKDSSHIRLAQVFSSQNVAFIEVDGPAKSKLMASVLFPKDAKRRLEVLWINNTTRTTTQVIAINGQSSWSAPLGLRLGLQMAALEKLNKKPFKITGFGGDGAEVASWEGGALGSAPGGCKLGLRMVMDQRAPEDARNKMAAAKELQSSDADVRAVRASVAEILIGY